ncbi:RhuM family protein [Capnocytophaga canimorsus]|uniref:RhuM family protein n=1 Tax=Capnocytophaga canimorsus TaxID=28188 RepID=UPI001AD175A3|nr:RhuM family protein [Capnocytophaga canimorsus]GIM58716.1 cytochrome c [Capnocytophaga canimorsus]
MDQIKIFTTDDEEVSLQVSFSKETVWLTLDQMAKLFNRDKSVISRHIKNVFNEKELDYPSVVAKFATTASDGKIYQVDYYNLDVIISVGYRVKSQRGVQFRKWATQTLKQHLVQGYTINEQRLKERGIEFNEVLSLLSSTLENQTLISDEGVAVLKVVQEYAKSWSLLQAYDQQSLPKSSLKNQEMNALPYEDVLKAIDQLKKSLVEKGEASELFGQIRSSGLESALATIEQGFGEEYFYPNVASRAAHLLYFIIKNHPFADGNKRTGAFLFLWYLRINQHLLQKPVENLINDNTLVALALLVAESKPEQKELIIRLTEHFINV